MINMNNNRREFRELEYFIIYKLFVHCYCVAQNIKNKLEQIILMRDWKRINENLVKRGSIFVDFSFLVKIGRKGRKFKYPNSLFYLGRSFAWAKQVKKV